MLKKILIIFVALGSLLGFFFGLPPAFILETGFLSHNVSQDILDARVFILLSSFWGYATILFVVAFMVWTVFTSPKKKADQEKKIYKNVFGSGQKKVQKPMIRQLTGLVDEELEKVFNTNQEEFGYEDYRKAYDYAVSIGVKIRKRAGDILRM